MPGAAAQPLPRGCGVCFCVGGELGPRRERGAAAPTRALVQPHLPLFSPSPSPSRCGGEPPSLPRHPEFQGPSSPPPYFGRCRWVRAGRARLSTHKRGAVAAAVSELPRNTSRPPRGARLGQCHCHRSSPHPEAVGAAPAPLFWGCVGGGGCLPLPSRWGLSGFWKGLAGEVEQMPQGWRLRSLAGFPGGASPGPWPVLGLQTRLQPSAGQGRASGRRGKAGRQTDRHPPSFPRGRACRGGRWQQRGVTDGSSPRLLSLAVTLQKLVFKLEFVSSLLFRTYLSSGPRCRPGRGSPLAPIALLPFPTVTHGTLAPASAPAWAPWHGPCGVGAGFGPVPVSAIVRPSTSALLWLPAPFDPCQGTWTSQHSNVSLHQ